MGETVFHNVRRDETGEPLLLVDESAITKLRVNFADWLESGETITAATVTTQNCTVSTSTTSPNVDLTISAVTSFNDGTITLVATCSNGEVWRSKIRVRRTNRYTDEQTYRDYT
jgi:hypothetical protein